MQALNNLFTSLTPELREVIIEQSTVKNFNAGEIVMKPGSFIGSAVIILSGKVKVFRVDEEGNSHFLYFLSAGELCVLSTLCCLRIRKADIRAVAYTECEIAFIPSPHPETWMQRYPEWNRYILQSFNRRMGEMLDVFDSVVFSRLDERLLYYLRQHLDAVGDRLNLSHQQIAEELNSSREVISRLLKKLEDAGYVQVNRLYVTLLPKIRRTAIE